MLWKGKKWRWWWKGWWELVRGWGRRLWLDQLEQTLQWGWRTSIELVPMQPGAPLPQTTGREEQRVRKSSRKTRREGERGMTEIEKKKKTQTTEGKSWGPKASKVAKGEKWRSNTVNAPLRVLNKASHGPVGNSADQLCSALRIPAPKRMKTNIFTSPVDAPCPSLFHGAARTDDQNSKGLLSSIELPAGEHLGAKRQAEGWVEYIVTLMRLSDPSWWSGSVFVPARLTLLNAHAVNPCWTLASHTKLRGR